MKTPKSIFLLSIAYLAFFALSCSTTAMSGTASGIPANNTITTDNAYIEELEALGLSISNQPMGESNPMNLFSALEYSLDAIGMVELAWTMGEAKAGDILNEYKIEAPLSLKEKQIAATALTIDLITPQWYTQYAQMDKLNAYAVGELIASVVDFLGLPIGSIGSLSDNDIFENLLNSWNRYTIVENNDLVNIVDEAVIQGTTTGYNVVTKLSNPSYNPELAIVYGHSDIKHALQLIGLLQSEDLEADVFFQGKTSAFLYLEDWGTPTESDTFKVKKIPSGDYVAYAKEYNIHFVFKTLEDKEAFNSVILAYAKKDSSDEPGLIYGSWWQPLYFSTTEMTDGYRTITDNVISYGSYEAHPYSLNETAAEAVEGFLEINSSLSIQSNQFWVNQAFFNYLMGEFK